MAATIEEVRIVTREIVEDITRVHEQCFFETLGWNRSFLSDVANYLNDFAELVGSSRSALWVSRVNGRVVGSVAVDSRDFGPSIGRLRLFAVEPMHHRRGIGGRLLRQSLEFCDAAGYSEVMLWTFDTLSGAKSLYLSIGFEVLAERNVQYWGFSFREQLCRLRLH